MDLEFFSEDWKPLGNKKNLRSQISTATGIDQDMLTGERPLASASVAKRMSWAAYRQTTREEDIAYCLMGIFEVNMPMLYGEGGQKAFLRLQEEIMKHSDDMSLFAWIDPSNSSDDAYHGLLADSPKVFANAGLILPYNDWDERSPYVMSNRGLSIDLHLTRCGEDLYAAVLDCGVPPSYNGFLAIYLKKLATGEKQYARVRLGKLGALDIRGTLQSVYVRQSIQDMGRHTVYPMHFFHLRKNPAAPQDYRLVATTFAPTQANEVSHLPKITTHALTWLTKMSPGVYKIVKGAGRLTAALLFRRPYDDEYFALMLGSITDFEVGFDIRKMDQLGSLEEMQTYFQPKPAGTPMVLKYHRVRVDVMERVAAGTKIYVIDIDIEIVATHPMAALVDVGEVLTEPNVIENRRKMWHKIGLHKG